jgi:hypothetical protein
MMVETEKKMGEKVWKKFLIKHWQMIFLFVVIAILAVTGAILVYLWFVEEAQLTGLVPAILGSWSMGNIVAFIIHLIFWEILYIGIPVIIIVVGIYFLWWKRIPDAERKEYKRANLPFGSRSYKRESGGGISFLVFIAFAIKVYTDGNWDVAIATWSFDYLVYSFLWALIWILIIFGIPIAIGATLWLRYEMKKNP